MAEIEDALTAFLLADGAVSALVGQRIFPLVVPFGEARPAVAYQRISTPERPMAHDGPLGIATARIQLTLEGRTYAEAKALARACRKRLDGYRGPMGAGDGLVVVHQTAVTNDLDGYSSETVLSPVVRCDVLIQHTED